MILSMTGYATSTREIPGGSLSIELKSVNGRFLDLQFRLPDEFRPIEPILRDLIASRVSRGKVECRIATAASASSTQALRLNHPLLLELAALERQIRAAMPDSQGLRVGEVLHWPGMLENDADAGDIRRTTALELTQATLNEFSASRAREGEKLKLMIIERVVRM